MRLTLRKKFWLTIGSLLVAVLGFVSWFEHSVDAINDKHKEMREEWRELEKIMELDRGVFDTARLIESYMSFPDNDVARTVNNNFIWMQRTLAYLEKMQIETNEEDPFQQDEIGLIRDIRQALDGTRSLWLSHSQEKKSWTPEASAELNRLIDSAAVRTKEFIRVENVEFKDEIDESREIEHDIDNTITGLVILLALFVILIATAFYRGIVGPVRRLHSSALRLQKRDFSEELQAQTNDEVGDLALAMNEMAREIKTFTDDLESQVQSRTSELIRSQRLAGIGSLAAGVAHEINNPLASILTCSEGLLRRIKRSENPTEQSVEQDYLETICKEVRRCHSIIEQLLDFSRKRPAVRKSNDACQLARNVAQLIQHTAEKNGCALKLDAPDRLLPVECDGDQIQQVLLNLMINAIEACAENGVIEISVHETPDKVEFIVKDNGCGIAPDELERVFEPFYSQKQSGEGTGLGLSVSHGIIESHRGSIVVYSDGPGAGTSVVVQLPKEADA